MGAPRTEATKLEKALIRAARRLLAAPPCKPGTWASGCERCKAKGALQRAVNKLDSHA